MKCQQNLVMCGAIKVNPSIPVGRASCLTVKAPVALNLPTNRDSSDLCRFIGILDKSRSESTERDQNGTDLTGAGQYVYRIRDMSWINDQSRNLEGAPPTIYFL